MREIYVEKCKKDTKLTKYLLHIYPSLSYGNIQKALRNKDIKVNDKRINKDVLIFENDKLTIYLDDFVIFNLPKSLDIMYKDENILVVLKPQGILSNTENESNYDKILGGTEITLEDLVKKDFENARICHRLDRNTAGLVIFSLNEKSYHEILDAFKNGIISKQYIAYVHNSNFPKNHEKLVKYLVKDSKTGYSKIYDSSVSNSQKIITEYFVKYIDEKLDYGVLDVIIHTGKTHQIRAGLANINHPIIGDSKYGLNEINKKFGVYKQMLYAVKYCFNFSKDSCLNYLNNIIIELDKTYYEKRLGSGTNE